MIDFIRGIIVKKTPGKIIIDINGVGFGILIPLSTFEKLPDVQNEIQLNTILHVKEDTIELFGFLTLDELNLFRNLLTVSKIGPKIALNVLSFISIENFKQALDNKDVAKLTKVSGIGKKTAQRIILELSGKLVFEEISSGSETPGVGDIFDDAVNALISLGLSKSEAVNSIKATGIEINDDTKIEELIRESLKKMKS